MEKKFFALLVEFREWNHRCSISKHDDDRIIRGRVIHSKFWIRHWLENWRGKISVESRYVGTKRLFTFWTTTKSNQAEEIFIKIAFVD